MTSRRHYNRKPPFPAINSLARNALYQQIIEDLKRYGNLSLREKAHIVGLVYHSLNNQLRTDVTLLVTGTDTDKE